MHLDNYLSGQWLAGADDGSPLLDPVLGTELARASSAGTDLAAALNYARTYGNPGLRALGYAARAQLLKGIAEVLTANRAAYFDLALANSGSPEGDAMVDIDGALFTLKHYARAGSALGDARYLVDGEAESLSKDGSFGTLHIQTPLRGVAIFINAFNFPAWGLWEKAAPALLAGMPVVIKPATPTALLTQRMVRDVVRAGILPDGALSIVCGAARDLLDHVRGEDVVSFTGSAETAARVRSHPTVVRSGARVNIEADSLNSAILGPDAAPDSAEFDLFIKEVARELTVKAGQKCTAVRRILVPAAQQEAVAKSLISRLERVTIGNPRNPEVRMGPLVSAAQGDTVRAGIRELQQHAHTLYDGNPYLSLIDADGTTGAFVAPVLLACDDPHHTPAVHDIEVFGPVATLMPYDGTAADAAAIARLGQGSLVASIFSADRGFARELSLELADSHGRVLVVDARVGKTQTGHGNVMPQCLHGGPGRAGGGEELGGLRALSFYHRRSALQGPLADLENTTSAGARLPS